MHTCNTDEKDGPYLKLQGYDQSSRSIMPVPAVTSSGSPTLRSHSAVPYSADGNCIPLYTN